MVERYTALPIQDTPTASLEGPSSQHNDVRDSGELLSQNLIVAGVQVHNDESSFSLALISLQHYFTA